ncbi:MULTISPECIES: hypothetical protein [Legionella]|uniref:Uncharacterized protein n=1 Tax=Legionella steelei TaxID=947033 RepID=A0A0W0ZG28_9GAMM|nr:MULTISPECIES: hypothetical protein [Legionella]KTD67782.1 hypothetical protein Lste_0940 [Legionella steelei]MBN9226837.1 hypothetical protein [Legionella steelei]OJW06613.1 MAG: hypothetical protein BGO44_17625 [Legionella sp. 39-23]
MSQFSTSKMLGKLAAGQGKPQFASVSSQKIEEVGEEIAAPKHQLTPSAKPSAELDMKNVLGASLAPQFSKGYSPMDKK